MVEPILLRKLIVAIMRTCGSNLPALRACVPQVEVLV